MRYPAVLGAGERRHGLQVAQHVVGQLVDRRIDRYHVIQRQHGGVAVGHGPGCELHGDVARRAGPVVHDPLLTQRFAEPRREDPGQRVGSSAGDVGTRSLMGRVGYVTSAAYAAAAHDNEAQRSRHRSGRAPL